MKSPRPRARFAAALVAASLGVAACGGGSTAEVTTTSPAAADGGSASSLFPDVDVVRISDGSTLNIQAELEGGDLPVLLWFWAPH